MMSRSRTSLLATSAVALELAAAALLRAGPAAGMGRLLAAALAHLLAAVGFAALLGARAERLKIEAAGRGGWFLFVTASAALPIVGPLALVVLLGRLARHDESPETGLARTALTPAGHGALIGPATAAAIGAGSLEARLRFDPEPASRVAAVLATRRLEGPADAVRLLRLGLRDKSEEVRLLAHALLEDRDRRAYAAIEAVTRELAASVPERRGPIAALLAEALLGLCTAGLVTGELEAFTLRRARVHIEEARASAPMRQSPTVALLHGRVLLRQGEARAACAAFEESRRLGGPGPLLAPYLAEAAFQTREPALSAEARA